MGRDGIGQDGMELRWDWVGIGIRIGIERFVRCVEIGREIGPFRSVWRVIPLYLRVVLCCIYVMRVKERTEGKRMRK